MKEINIKKIETAAALLDLKDMIGTVPAQLFKYGLIGAGAIAIACSVLSVAIAISGDPNLAADVWIRFGNCLPCVCAGYFLGAALYYAVKEVANLGIRILGCSEIGIERMALHY